MPEGKESGSSLPVERKLSTILSADVAEFSRLMGEDEEQTLRTFRGHKKIFESLVEMHHGRIFNTAGDAILAEFSSAVEAVRCATDIQSALRTRNDQLPPNRQVRFRIGINLGDVMIQGKDLLGDGVNVAARLQTAAEPGGVCISGSVHDQIRNKLSLSFLSLGEKTYKNIQQPVRTFSIMEAEGGRALPVAQPRTPWKNTAVWIAAALLLAGGGGYAAYVVHQHSQPENPPATAANVQPAPAPAPAPAPTQAAPPAEPAKPAIEKPATEQPQPKAKATPPVTRKAELAAPAAKAAPAARAPATNPRPGAYDGSYSGKICYGATAALRFHCYQANGVVRGNKITGSWPLPGHADHTMTLEGKIASADEVTILMHSDRPDGTRVNTINFTGAIHGGAIEADGKFLNGRPATLNWHLNSDAPH